MCRTDSLTAKATEGDQSRSSDRGSLILRHSYTNARVREITLSTQLNYQPPAFVLSKAKALGTFGLLPCLVVAHQAVIQQWSKLFEFMDNLAPTRRMNQPLCSIHVNGSVAVDYDQLSRNVFPMIFGAKVSAALGCLIYSVMYRSLIAFQFPRDLQGYPTLEAYFILKLRDALEDQAAL